MRRYTRYHFGDYAIGESRFLAGDYEHGHSMQVAAQAYAKTHPGFRFTVRRVSGGYSCTRIAVSA